MRSALAILLLTSCAGWAEEEAVKPPAPPPEEAPKPQKPTPVYINKKREPNSAKAQKVAASLDIVSLEKGQQGEIETGPLQRIMVKQVLPKNDCVVTIQKRTIRKNGSKTTITDKAGKKTEIDGALGDFEDFCDVWVSGVSLENVVDDKLISFKGITFEVTGTKTFQTVLGGSRTIHHLQAINE